MKNLSIIIIEKTGIVKTLCVKDYNQNELYKKCGFTKSDDFIKQTEWNKKIDSVQYNISVYGKLKGKANFENKYEFPPPIDNKLFFGSCAIICKKINENKEYEYCNITIPLWNKIYEKLMGGFEDLSKTLIEDENEDDELKNIPNNKKTKTGGYLKDGFVIDDDSDEPEEDNYTENTNTDSETEEEIEITKHSKPKKKKRQQNDNNEVDDTNIDITTELIEEEFSDDE
jgi:hypothetical protein